MKTSIFLSSIAGLVLSLACGSSPRKSPDTGSPAYEPYPLTTAPDREAFPGSGENEPKSAPTLVDPKDDPLPDAKPKLVPNMPRQTWPIGAIAPVPDKPKPCVAELELSAKRVAGNVEIEAKLRSRSRKAVTITLDVSCPRSSLEWSGIAQGYDVEGLCTRGACVEPKTEKTFTVPAGEGFLSIERISLPEKGDSCRPPLAPGKYDVYASGNVLDPENHLLCGMAHASFEIPAPPKAPSPAASCKRAPACDLHCDGPFARDASGCTLCACDDSNLTR